MLVYVTLSNTRLHAAAGQTAVHFKVPLRRALTHSGRRDAVMTLSENVTSQPSVLLPFPVASHIVYYI